MREMRALAVSCLILLVAASIARGASPQDSQAPPRGWTAGPTIGRLASLASISVPEGFIFLDAEATKQFLVETQNVPDGDELGAVVRYRSEDDNWFVIFSYRNTGHVDDSDRNTLDADALLKSVQEGTKADNEERAKRGWDPMVILGWFRQPFYDMTTNNLTWSIHGSSKDGEVIKDCCINNGTMVLEVRDATSRIGGLAGRSAASGAGARG